MWRNKRAAEQRGRRDAKLNLDVRFYAQRHTWALVFTTLDVSLSNGGDVGPSDGIGWRSQRKFEPPDQRKENGFDPVRAEYGSRQQGS